MPKMSKITYNEMIRTICIDYDEYNEMIYAYMPRCKKDAYKEKKNGKIKIYITRCIDIEGMPRTN